MLTAIRKKLGLKVSLTLALVMLVLTAVVATYITFDQTATLEQSILKKAQLAANLGAQSYGAVLEQAADNGLLTISDVFDTNYQVVPGWDWGQNPKYHTKYDVVTDNATIVVLDKFLDDKDFIYAIGADRNGYVPTHNSIFNQPLTGNATEDLANSRSKRIFKDPVALAITKSTEDGFQQVYKRDTGEVMWDVSSPSWSRASRGVTSGWGSRCTTSRRPRPTSACRCSACSLPLPRWWWVPSWCSFAAPSDRSRSSPRRQTTSAWARAWTSPSSPRPSTRSVCSRSPSTGCASP